MCPIISRFNQLQESAMTMTTTGTSATKKKSGIKKKVPATKKVAVKKKASATKKVAVKKNAPATKQAASRKAVKKAAAKKK